MIRQKEPSDLVYNILEKPETKQRSQTGYSQANSYASGRPPLIQGSMTNIGNREESKLTIDQRASKTQQGYFAGIDMSEFKNMDYDNISNYGQKMAKNIQNELPPSIKGMTRNSSFKSEASNQSGFTKQSAASTVSKQNIPKQMFHTGNSYNKAIDPDLDTVS